MAASERPNGATVEHFAGVDRWLVKDWRGRAVGWRRTEAEAMALAEMQPGEPAPRVRPELVERWAPQGVPYDERRDFDFSAPPRGAPPVQVRDGIERNRAMSRRQAVAFQRVYGKHLGRGRR